MICREGQYLRRSQRAKREALAGTTYVLLRKRDWLSDDCAGIASLLLMPGLYSTCDLFRKRMKI